MRDKVTSVLIILIGIVLTLAMWTWFTTISDAIEQGLLRTIFWIGLIGVWGGVVIIKPINIIMGGEPDYKGMLKGVVYFAVAVFIAMMSYWVFPPILEALEDAFSSTIFSAIGWFALILFWVISLILVPLYMVFKTGFKKI